MGRNMYSDYFGIQENAFSITPDPRFLFKSEQHCEALAHLLYGVVESGCFVLLTGEVGTGKTTICRTLLDQLPENVDVALLLTPPQTGRDLLLAITDELHVLVNHRDNTLHELVYVLTRRLLENHSQGRRTVGVGAGQMSRVVSVEIAVKKAGEAARGSVLASDAFFPFPDGVEAETFEKEIKASCSMIL